MNETTKRTNGTRDARNLIDLGHIAGISIRLNWSVLLIVFLLGWSLASVLLPAEVPGYAPGAYWVAGLLAAAGLFVGILLHELGHALMARRHGVAVDSITLWLFGGIAMLENEAPDPKAEAKIAGIGPAVSIGLGIFAGAVAFLVGLAGGPALVAASIYWFAGINLVLAVFNLVPGAPLDGGRLLHAFLWRRHGDRIRATVTASKAGRFIGGTLIGLGFAQLLFFGDLGGLWTAFIGWFLSAAATTEAQQTVARHAMEGVLVRDVMTADPEVAPDWISVDEFIHRFVLTSRHATFPLEAWDGSLTGLVTLNDLKRVAAGERSETRVRTVATPLEQIPIVGPDDAVTDLLEQISRSGYQGRRALVFDAGSLVGIVTSADLAAAIERRSMAGTVPATYGVEAA